MKNKIQLINQIERLESILFIQDKKTYNAIAPSIRKLWGIMDNINEVSLQKAVVGLLSVVAILQLHKSVN